MKSRFELGQKVVYASREYNHLKYGWIGTIQDVLPTVQSNGVSVYVYFPVYGAAVYLTDEDLEPITDAEINMIQCLKGVHGG